MVCHQLVCNIRLLLCRSASSNDRYLSRNTCQHSIRINPLVASGWSDRLPPYRGSRREYDGCCGLVSKIEVRLKTFMANPAVAIIVVLPLLFFTVTLEAFYALPSNLARFRKTRRWITVIVLILVAPFIFVVAGRFILLH